MAEDTSVGWKIAAGLLAFLVPIGAIALLAGTAEPHSNAKSVRRPRRNPGGYTPKRHQSRNEYHALVSAHVADLWERAQRAEEDDGSYGWDPVSVAGAKRIWSQFTRDGYVRNEKGLDRLSSDIVDKIAELHASSMLLSRQRIAYAPQRPSTAEYMASLGMEVSQYDPDTEAKLDWFLRDESGNLIVSDTEMDTLADLAMSIMDTTDATEKIVLVDRVFNVAHQRTDLASWIIEGGRKSLDAIAHDDDD